MTDDLIKREDAINALNECNDIRGYAYRQMHDALTEIPSAEPKRGEWVDINIRDDYKALCSCCGVWSTVIGNFCPNCGARMKGADDE